MRKIRYPLFILILLAILASCSQRRVSYFEAYHAMNSDGFHEIVDEFISLSFDGLNKDSIARGYYLKGYVFHLENKLDSALFYYIKSQYFANEISDNELIATVLQSIGSLYFKGDLEEQIQAQSFYEEAYIASSKLNHWNNRLYILQGLVSSMCFLEDYEEMEYFLDELETYDLPESSMLLSLEYRARLYFYQNDQGKVDSVLSVAENWLNQNGISKLAIECAGLLEILGDWKKDSDPILSKQYHLASYTPENGYLEGFLKALDQFAISEVNEQIELLSSIDFDKIQPRFFDALEISLDYCWLNAVAQNDIELLSDLKGIYTEVSAASEASKISEATRLAEMKYLTEMAEYQAHERWQEQVRWYWLIGSIVIGALLVLFGLGKFFHYRSRILNTVAQIDSKDYLSKLSSLP